MFRLTDRVYTEGVILAQKSLKKYSSSDRISLNSFINCVEALVLQSLHRFSLNYLLYNQACEKIMNLYNNIYTLDTDSVTFDGCTTANSVVYMSTENPKTDMDKKPDRKLVSFRLPEDLMQELRDRADVDGISVTELVCRLLRQGLQASTDDRMATLEAEIRELRKLKQVNFNPIPPAPFYTLLPQGLVPPESDFETKRRIADLEVRMEEVLNNVKSIDALPAYLAKLEALLKEVQTSRVAAQNQPTNPQDPACQDAEQRATS